MDSKILQFVDLKKKVSLPCFGDSVMH